MDEQAHRHEPEPASEPGSPRDPAPRSDAVPPPTDPSHAEPSHAEPSHAEPSHAEPRPGGEPGPLREAVPPTATPSPAAPQVPPPPPEAWAQPVRIEPVAGTPYGLAILGAPSATSGPAVGALVCGIASILVSLLVTCFGLAGAADGWGVWVAGAFAVLAGCLGLAGIGLGIGGIRQTRDRRARAAPPPPYHTGQHATGYPGGAHTAPYPAGQHHTPYASGAHAAGTWPAGPASAGPVRNGPQTRGRGMAIAGLACGIAGVAITVCVLGVVAVIQFV